MKKYCCLSFLIAFMVSCSGVNTNTKANTALVEDYVNAVQNLDYDSMETYLSEDYIGYGPSLNDSIGKSGAVENWKRNIAELYKKIEYKRSRVMAVSIEDGPNKGDWVSNWAELEITYKESGEIIKIMTNTVYMIEANKISKSYTFYNEADALDQLGYIFLNPDNL
ncbi:MAG: hypothetical protein ACJAUR_000004 [Ulvibacter sp.]|jgi:hypothetical protein|tara:strand:+ start:533 stop:1030 length:498 start_codon:yes stop_codon:yes gene_type:complete